MIPGEDHDASRPRLAEARLFTVDHVTLDSDDEGRHGVAIRRHEADDGDLLTFREMAHWNIGSRVARSLTPSTYSLTKSTKSGILEVMQETALSRVQAVRAFNRFWTARIGVLDATHLGTPFSLAEARVLFEVAHRGEDSTEVATLRRVLDLDAGYLSRLLSELRAKKVVTTGASESDARCQVVRLTAKGKGAARALDERAVAHVRELLSSLGEDDQQRLQSALHVATRLLSPRPRETKPASTVLRPPRAGDFGWIVERHGALYAREYGWDERFEGLVASIVAKFLEAREPRSAAWIAEVDGERAGSVLCTRKNEKTAQLRLLLVEPQFRGLGLGRRLVDECVAFARASGYRRLTLWTNDVLTAARKQYERAGFVLVASKKHDSFGKRLTGQTWELDVRGSS